MAGADRSTSDHLSFLRRAAAEPRAWGFLSLLRRAEAMAPRLPRIGRSRLPSQNVADLAQTPALAFPAATIEEIEQGPSGRSRVRSPFFGLTGPMGPLPTHLTEYAFYERRMGENRPFGRWLDVLSERMLQFFYRAWADSQPAAQADRPNDDRFAAYLDALSGAGVSSLPVGEGLPRERRLHYAGAFISRRSAAVLRDALAHLLRRPVRLEEFAARWRDVEPSDRSRLGRLGGYNQLGRDTMLGGRVRQAEDTFRLIIRARDAEDYRRLLPGQPAYAEVCEAVRALKPSELSCELQLELAESEAPAARLDGTSPLGLMSWAAPKGRSNVLRADARMTI